MKLLSSLAVFSGILLIRSVNSAIAVGGSPWENAVSVLQQAFTSTIARGLSLVAIVVSGLTFAFGEGGSKRVLAGVLFGVGMAIAAVNFMAWLFPGQQIDSTNEKRDHAASQASKHGPSVVISTTHHSWC